MGSVGSADQYDRHCHFKFVGEESEGLADLVAQIVKVRLLPSDLLPTPVRTIDHRLAAKLQDAKSQLPELAAVHDAAELREAHACIQKF